MPKIQITGYINTDKLEPEEVDLDSELGLSAQGFETMSEQLDDIGVEAITFRLES